MSQTEFETRIEQMDAMCVACLRVIGKEPEDQSIAELKAWVARNLPDQNKVRLLGCDVPVDEATRKKGLRGYESWAVVPAGTQPGEGVEIRVVPANSYVCHRSDDPMADPFAGIGGGWDGLIAWLGTSEYPLDLPYERVFLEEVIKTAQGTVMDIRVSLLPFAA